MSIRGGITSSENEIEVSFTKSGGGNYKRVYNDVVSVAINKFSLISTTLSKLLVSKMSKSDIKFYIDQIKILLQRSHVELIPGELPFHDKYNMWLLDGYVRMLLETADLKLITQLLDIDSILYSIEEERLNQNICGYIDFKIPDKIKVKTLAQLDNKAEISSPMADELSAYIHSLNNNLVLLNLIIESNKESFFMIYKSIIATASKYLK